MANVENLPDELTHIADKIYINFPWGTLLRGTVLVDELMWENIKKICKNNALVHIVFGYSIEHDRKEVERFNLPHLNESYVHNTMIFKFSSLGFKTTKIKKLNPLDLRNYPTTWAKKLSFGTERCYYYIELKNQE